MEPKAHLIELQRVERTYSLGDTVVNALQGVSLTVDHGAFVAIMGSSGSGKSTLMNIVGCLDKPTSGHYLLDGRYISDLDRDELALVRNRTIGFVFQSFNLLARTTAVENVELPMIYAGLPAKERRERAVRALERVGLGSRLDHVPNQLSGGQQQRVAVARAIVMQPKLILADEPTGNLDSATSHEIMSLFQELSREGITVILVTHEADVAAFASRVVLMRDGRVLSDSPQKPAASAAPQAVLQAPRQAGGVPA